MASMRSLLTVGLATALAACAPQPTGGGDLGNTPCEPGASMCADGSSAVCRPDGTGYDVRPCDPLQGSACDVDTGECRGPCEPDQLGRSYVGCDYWPTITGNEVNSNFDFGVAVSNTASEPATVTIEWGGLPEARRYLVEANSVRVVPLPWVPELKGCMSYDNVACSGITRPMSALVPRGAYHLRSTRPVTVYQFNPIDYHKGDLYSYTNDASLLLPTTAMTEAYIGLTWPYLAGNYRSPSLMAITATRDDTSITVLPTTDTEDSGTLRGLRAGVPASFTLHQGDVLQFFTTQGDLSGTQVLAEHPVQVIAGHFCTFIPETMGYCDHLEESMFPLQTLSTEYAVAAPVLPQLPDGKVRHVRIVATQDDTRLTYDPPQAAADYLARAGDVIQIAENAETFVIRADKEIMVAQFMEGETMGGNAGDPAMALAAPTVQWREQYLFHAPLSYDMNYADVIAPSGTKVTLDGLDLSGFQPIGGSGLELVRVPLSRGDGNHRLEADEPVGVSVYGYGQYTSYWYPAGLDLEEVYVP